MDEKDFSAPWHILQDKGPIECEKKLLAKVRILEKIVESIPAGIVLLEMETEGMIRYANSQYYEIIGYTPQEVSTQFHNKGFHIANQQDLLKVMPDIKKQLEYLGSCFFDARVTRKDGKEIWVQIRGLISTEPEDAGVLYCIVTDITHSVEAKEALMKEQNRNKLFLELSDDVFWCELDLKQDTITFSKNFAVFFQVPHYMEQYPKSAVVYGLIPKEGIQDYFAFIEAVKNGREGYFIEYPVKRYTGEQYIHRIQYKLLYDTLGNPTKLIGKITDVTMEKEKLQQLLQKTQVDPLTKLYNKVESELRVERYLKEYDGKWISALFLIDVDNFKGVNDSLGHQFGDTVLMDFSSRLKSLFRESDVVGRVGGDEFLVFLRNVKRMEDVMDKAESLVSALNLSYRGKEQTYHVSASIGIALFPSDTIDYKTLYYFADQALYESKKKGKACYTFYHTEIIEESPSAPVQPAREARLVDQVYGEDFIYRIFEMLYETKDISTTLNRILGMIGNRLGVESGYILLTEEGVENSYFWESNGETGGDMDAVPFALFRYLEERHREEEVFYCQYTSETDESLKEKMDKKQVKSLLRCTIGKKKNGSVLGYMGFHGSTDLVLWKKDDVATVGYIAKILSVFLHLT